MKLWHCTPPALISSLQCHWARQLRTCVCAELLPLAGAQSARNTPHHTVKMDIHVPFGKKTLHGALRCLPPCISPHHLRAPQCVCDERTASAGRLRTRVATASCDWAMAAMNAIGSARYEHLMHYDYQRHHHRAMNASVSRERRTYTMISHTARKTAIARVHYDDVRLHRALCRHSRMSHGHTHCAHERRQGASYHSTPCIIR